MSAILVLKEMPKTCKECPCQMMLVCVPADEDIDEYVKPNEAKPDWCPLIQLPVVRCKDCKYNVANMEKDPLDMNDYTDIVCSYFMTDGMEPYDFCSKGELYESRTGD